ncbi:MAG: glycoside hydrolase [Opitutaceae bacterium]|nr:glycoside hydrolase [Opitutaceae bacterium]
MALGGAIGLLAAAAPATEPVEPRPRASRPAQAAARQKSAPAPKPTALPATFTVRNSTLEVTLDSSDATLSVLDRRSQRRWVQRRLRNECILKTATASGDRLELSLTHRPTGLEVRALLQLDGNQPEFTVTLSAEGGLKSPLGFPEPFTGEPGDSLVVPLNEGISYPVDDPTITPMRLIAYGGHGICMAFWGLTDGEKGQMAILETPDDVSIRMDRLDGRLVIAPSWESQRGEFGYARRVRYVFLDRGGHVAMAKRYRASAQQLGLVKTLAEKRALNPNVERLLGAVNVWCWEKNAVEIVKELQAAGIQRVLWSNRQGPEGISAMNALGVLTSRYDIYQDVMDPANFSRLRGIHADWTTSAWPKDLMLDRAGNWIKGWGVTAKDGTMLNCGVLCDRQAVTYARDRIPPELATHPYLGRFIDTTTASPWRECYSPEHPMTRTDSKRWKMELLRYVSADNRMVTGCETGHDASVPYLHFFEGMMSLGPYRVPDAGRRMQQIWDEVPERVAKFQLGHGYRLPLWELVFHDCVVSYWYWGDYNNKLPALWDKRDLFNVLYGAPPMFMFTRKYWEENRARFVASYQTTCPLAREVGAAEMTDHRFLTANREVQQTTFANGISIAVNFGSSPHQLAGGETIPPMGHKVIRGR